MIAAVERQTALSAMACRIGEFSFAIDAQRILSLHTGEELIPQDDPLRIGFLSTSAAPIPVISLAMLLGIETSASDDSWIAVFEGEKEPWGILVDSLSDAVSVPNNRIFPMPASLGESAGCFEFVLSFDGVPVPLLSPERIDPDSTGVVERNPLSSLARRNLEDVFDNLPRPAQRNNRILLFRLLNPAWKSRPVSFALPMESVLEVTAFPTCMRMPEGIPGLIGLAVWKGMVLPVLDPVQKLGLEPQEINQRSRLAVVRRGGHLVGLLTRSEIESIAFDVKHAISERELGIDREAVLSVIELRESTVILPNLERFLV